VLIPCSPDRPPPCLEMVDTKIYIYVLIAVLTVQTQCHVPPKMPWSDVSHGVLSTLICPGLYSYSSRVGDGGRVAC